MEENELLRQRIEQKVCARPLQLYLHRHLLLLSLTLSSLSLSLSQDAEVKKLKEITEPQKEYFHQGGFTLAVDLAIAESICKAHVSRNQVPLLFIIFARFFRITLPKHSRRVPYKKVDGKMTSVERELLYVPGKTHVKEVCATLNMAHKLQIGTQLLETEGDSYCYVADGAESLQSEYLVQLLSRRDENGKLQTTALDLNLLHSKTSEAQAAAFRESLRLTAELLKDLGITDEVSPRLLAFTPASTMNDRAAPARKAARLVRGMADGNDDPTCASLLRAEADGHRGSEGPAQEAQDARQEGLHRHAVQPHGLRAAAPDAAARGRRRRQRPPRRRLRHRRAERQAQGERRRRLRRQQRQEEEEAEGRHRVHGLRVDQEGGGQLRGRGDASSAR